VHAVNDIYAVTSTPEFASAAGRCARDESQCAKIIHQQTLSKSLCSKKTFIYLKIS